MLLMSTQDETELENMRTRFGGCQLPPKETREARAIADILVELPSLMSLLLRARLREGGSQEPLCLRAEEVADIESVSKLSRREIMILLLDVASVTADMLGEMDSSSAVVEGASGALYAGIPVSWKGKGVKFSTHGAQSAVLNAWHQGETQIRAVAMESAPCACCRQFLREVWTWSKIKVVVAQNGIESLKTGAIDEVPLNLQGLRLEGVKGRLMNEAKRGVKIPKSQTNELINTAAEAASWSYAPYSRNFAGAAVKTKQGAIYRGRYIEVRDSLVGMLAIEAALVNVVLNGESISNVLEILLVETRGTVTQFSATQKLAQAMGDIPFRFMMTA